MKRSVVSTLAVLGIAILGMGFSARSAMADTVEITVLPGGTASWNGSAGSGLTFTGSTVTIVVTDGSSNALFLGKLTATTGGEISGDGSTGSPYVFGANNAANAITVSDLVDMTPGFFNVSGDLFSGTITGASLTMGSSTGGSLTFVVGNLNANLLADFGATGGNSYGGSVSTALSGSSPSELTMGSSDAILNPVATPEPTSLLMLGSGLVGLIGLRRRKVAA